MSKRKLARLYKPDTEEVVADFTLYLNSFPGFTVEDHMQKWQKSILTLTLDVFFPKYGYVLMKVKK